MRSLKIKNCNPHHHNPTVRTHASPDIYTVPAHRTAHIKKVLATTWLLTTEFKDSVLLNHFIIYWDRAYFQQQSSDGTIYKDGRHFKVIYHNCTPEDCAVQIAGVSGVSSSNQLALSFRVPRYIFDGAYPVVLVSPSRSTRPH
jgi:hypothetical protein